mgnify:CR=1 FL=1
MPQAGAHPGRQFRIYLALSQYPILSSRIRARMRRELFERGVITQAEFEAQVRQLAIQTQEWEGLRNPFSEEPSDLWEVRLSRVRDQHTDFLFSQFLSYELFEQLVWEVLRERGIKFSDQTLGINLEIAPLEMVFEQAIAMERMPPQERAPLEARLKESKVVIIRTMISDQLGYLEVAKEWFTVADLVEIRRRKIGTGRIGGKAAGMLLALRILQSAGDPELVDCIKTPESFFIGSDVFYTFMTINNLVHWNDQKYKTEEEMRADYPTVIREFEAGQFPPDILDQLRGLLETVGKKPLIVRSSSLLEDNFGTSFAGKYESVFCPNQGNPSRNLRELTRAIARVYSSTVNPAALLYRRSKRLQDYDERMAILIQVVEGEPFGRYYLPHAAGVAFSRNLYRWAPQIRREDGFVRLVWGLGTRAVERVGNDYPRLIALSHPLLRPAADPKSIRRYSQQYVDVIDLEDNQFKTLPVKEVLQGRYPPLRYLAQIEEDGYFSSLRSTFMGNIPGNLVVTFDGLLQRTPFAQYMREILHILEENYQIPVDMEFTINLGKEDNGSPNLSITILQCRPQSHHTGVNVPPIPDNLEEEDIIFSSTFMVPDGYIAQIDYVVFIVPEIYFGSETTQARRLLAQAIGKLNESMAGETFILVGPGRWGSSNPDLGVPIVYGDIYHSKALVEITGEGIGLAPEPSLGTHFFQDLMEAQIYPLAIYLDDPTAVFNKKFFYQAPNCLADRLPELAAYQNVLRLIRVSEYLDRHYLRIIMDQEKNKVIAFLTDEE